MTDENPNWTNLATHPVEWSQRSNQERCERQKRVVVQRAPGPHLRTLDPRAVRAREWLWRGFLPLGKFVGFEGAGDVGKTFVLVDLITRIVQGQPMPDGSTGLGPAAVLWVTDEEGGGEETRRLLAAGLSDRDFRAVATLAANTDGQALELPRDCDLLRAAVDKLEILSGLPVRLILLDPLFQFLEGSIDENKAKQVRQACAPLAPLARELGVCIIGLRHWNKSVLQPRKDRGAGSAQFSSTFRVQLAVFRHPTDPELRVLSNEMNRYVPDADRGPLGFRLVPVPEFESARVEWIGPLDIDEIRESGMSKQHDRCTDWLRSLLDDRAKAGCSPVDKAEVLRLAEAAGFSGRTVERAASALKLLTNKPYGGTATWALPTPGEVGGTGDVDGSRDSNLANTDNSAKHDVGEP